MPFFVNAPDALYSFQFDLVRLVFRGANIKYISGIIQILCLLLPSEQKEMVMTKAQTKSIYVQIWQCMGIIAEDENKMKRVAKYVAKLVKEKERNAATAITMTNNHL